MSNTFSNGLVLTLSEGISAIQKLTSDIPEAIFSSKPKVGGKTISINHPAFQIGHLSLYPPRIKRLLGATEADAPIDEQEKALFWKGTPCSDDPECRIYPSKEATLQRFTSAYSELTKLLSDLDEKIITSPASEEAWQNRFGSTGLAIMYLVGGVDFSGLKLVMSRTADGAAAATLAYGSFIQRVVDFTIVAFALFLVVKAMNTLRKKDAPEAAPAPATPEDVLLLREIRDSLKNK